MHNFSMPEPKNEPIINYKQDQASWDALQKAVESLPLGKEIPMIIGGKKSLFSKKRKKCEPFK